MVIKFLFFALFSTVIAWANVAETERQVARECQAHVLLGDAKRALQVAEAALEEYPHSQTIHEAYLIALCKNHLSSEIYPAWNAFFCHFPECGYQRELLEEMGWAIVEKGAFSGAITTRLIGIIGAALTQDVRAVAIIKRGLLDSNSLIRKVSLELASHFGDASLKEVVAQRLEDEKKEEVRLGVISAIAALRIYECTPKLFALLSKGNASLQEKQLAVQALVSLQKGISREELLKLASSNRALFRQLACQIIAKYQLQEEALLKKLALDAHPEVALYALKAMGLAQINAKKTYLSLSHSIDPSVAITAGWALLLSDHKEGQKVLERFLVQPKPKVQLLAAAALRAAGPFGLQLTLKYMQEHPHQRVRVNLALAALEQRKEVEIASSIISTYFASSTEKWMWREELGGLFSALDKSTIKHSGAIPNLPEAMNQKVHLEILNLLAVTEGAKVEGLIAKYLKTTLWDVSGLAAELLLEEGDSEAIDLVKGLLKENNQKIKLQAALILAMWGRDPVALNTLMELYPKCPRPKKIAILEALARIGSKEAVPFLVKQLGDPSETLRLIAASVLIQTLNH